MKPKRKIINLDQILRRNSKSPILSKVTLLVATLVGMVVSVLLLIFFKKKPIQRPTVSGTVNPERNSDVTSEPSEPMVADDDPKIFNLRTLLYFTGFLVGLVAFVVVIGALLAGSSTSGRSVVIIPAPTLLPPEPRLEAYPAENFPIVHATQEAELNSYGWVDRQNGVVHIPIDRAMEMIAQSHLPVVPGTPVSTPPAP